MDTLKVEQIRQVVIDSVKYVRSSDVSAFYADLADKQATQFTILISVLCGIIVIVIGATWWWNYRGAKQQIKDEVDNLKMSLVRMLRLQVRDFEKQQQAFNQRYDTDKITLEESLKKYVEEKSKEIEERSKRQIDNYEADHNKALSDLQKNTESKIKMDRAELSRLFALYTTSQQNYRASISWLLNAAKLYKEREEEEILGHVIRALRNNIEEVDTISKEDIDNLIKDVKETIPPLMQTEKDEILSKLKELKKKQEQDYNSK